MKNYLLNHSFSSHKLPVWTMWFMTIHSFINTSAYLWEYPKTPFSMGIIWYRFNLFLSDLLECVVRFFYCSFLLCIHHFLLYTYPISTLSPIINIICVNMCVSSHISTIFFITLLCENYRCIFIGTLYSQYGAIYYIQSSSSYRF